MKSLVQGTCAVDVLQSPQHLPSGCCTDSGAQGTPVSCLLEGGRQHTLLTPLHHGYSTLKISPFLGLFNGGCSRAANPARAGRLLCWSQRRARTAAPWFQQALSPRASEIFTFSY